MLPQQRHLEIRHALDRQGGVKVSELARRLDVTEETVRRDLALMEREGLLVRTHGGALPVPSPDSATPYLVREVERVQEKRAIARIAVREIEEGDAVFLDGSTTAHQLARVFPDIRCTVLTNSQPILMELRSRTNVDLLSTGGSLDRRSDSFIGPLAEQMISLCQLTKVFLGCKGVDFKRGFSDPSVRMMNLKRSVMQWGERTYILADASKFDERSRYFFASISDVNVVISDPSVSPAHREALRRAGVRMICE